MHKLYEYKRVGLNPDISEHISWKKKSRKNRSIAPGISAFPGNKVPYLQDKDRAMDLSFSGGKYIW